MKTAICCIAKCENNYIREWVDYHLALGFDNIFICDNNNVDGERIKPLFDDNRQVVVLDWRGKKACQSMAYSCFYKSIGKDYDWIAYIDIDEFITFAENSGLNTIEEFLDRFDDSVDMVHLNWMCFGDNGIVDVDNFGVLKRFVNPLDYEKKIMYDFPENNHVKSLIRGGLDIGDSLIGIHTTKEGKDFSVVDAEGKNIVNDNFKPYNFSTVYIRHFVTKTIVEWLLKISRGRATLNASSELYPIEKFFLYNEKTPEKEKIVDSFLMFKKSIEQSIATDLGIYKKELEYTKNQLAHVSRDYNVVVNSKAYKIGRVLLKPFKIFIR